MIHETHVCAALPKRHLTVDLVWCSTHQAWTLATQSYTEDGDELMSESGLQLDHFGPFDGAAEVTAAIVQRLHEMGLQQA